VSDEGLKLLAPGLASALIGDVPAALDALPPDDRERMLLARSAVGKWIDDAEQVPPSEIIDRVLAESAYAVEIGGPGFRQARENLKKVRGLIRRIQNRGYTTLARLTDYFDGLAAGGDESNAIIDAADAVNLMTVHAAKGLEFPVVFIVNIGKGSGGTRDDIRVQPAPFVDGHDEDGDPAVAVTDHDNPEDRDDDAREHEESKRLLYVALTRARDRLYLAGSLTGGKLVLQRGSIGKVLPASLTAAMAAGGESDEISWAGGSSTHLLRRVRISLP
jgi:ATP-dependent helicase/nuclease subunit A